MKREITRRVARGELLDGLLEYISGLLVEVASPTRKISFEMLRRRMDARARLFGEPTLAYTLPSIQPFTDCFRG